jgi:uncharacterized protein (TIGR03382 family)
MLALPACDNGEGRTESAENVTAGLAETATSGNLTLTVTADRERARVAEPVHVTVAVRAPEGVEIEFPDLTAALEDFLVRDHSPVETETTADGVQIIRQTYDLDSNLSGPREIPALTILTAEGEAATEPLTVEVVSAIEGEYDPSEFADIVGPMSIPQPRNWTPIVVGAGAALALAVLVWWLLRRRRARANAVAPPPPPHVWALQQLDALLADQLVERGLVHEFYYRLSGLTRTYIELRFALMAPERTTEEFLVEVQRSDALRFGHKDLLGEFLTACDLVKFARHQPRGEEIDRSIDAARTFIEQTAPAPVRETAA